MSFTDAEIWEELAETCRQVPDLSSLRVTCRQTSWQRFRRGRAIETMPAVRGLLLAYHKRQLKAWPGVRPLRPEFPSLRRYPDICESIGEGGNA